LKRWILIFIDHIWFPGFNNGSILKVINFVNNVGQIFQLLEPKFYEIRLKHCNSNCKFLAWLLIVKI
jgi:hypothetical protein